MVANPLDVAAYFKIGADRSGGAFIGLRCNDPRNKLGDLPVQIVQVIFPLSYLLGGGVIPPQYRMKSRSDICMRPNSISS